MVEKSQEPGQGQNSVVDPEDEELAKQQEELKKLEQELEESK